jgi:predicted phosphodiesterase
LKIHILSDLHTEHVAYQRHQVDCDVVVFAGDVASGAKGLQRMRQDYPVQEIIYVPGNHEFYRLDRVKALAGMRVIAKSLGIHLLDNDELILGSTRFLGSTLWTDFELFGVDEKPYAMQEGRYYLNDFKLIQEGDKLFTPQRSIELHRESVTWLEQQLNREVAGVKATVVVTHHLPSMSSVSSRYRNSLLSACFASNLNHLLGKSQLWIHGHTHDSFDYELNGTRVICNPHGYQTFNGIENSDFDPLKVVEVF